MFVELIYDKRNVAGLPNAQQMILDELEKRIQRVFPEADVRVKPMQANSVKTDASKSDKAVMMRVIEEMFEEADQWLVTGEY
ncbi:MULTISPECIES: DinI-like family protein [unclassified Erwinia]|uniref:DinI-like family protein n=1 Tax=Erwinia TaxID=551 RepID=UPI0008350B75|nr:DinI-like family protein [Erwinia sp. ErVv1]